jgi:hypothetical protein
MKKILLALFISLASIGAHAQFTVIQGLSPNNAYVTINTDLANNLAVNCVQGCSASSGTGGLAANGSPPIGNPLWTAGWDGTDVRAFRTDSNGYLGVNLQNTVVLGAGPNVIGYAFSIGSVADGSPAGSSQATYPVRVAGWDGTNLHTLKTDSSGNVGVNIQNTPSVTVSGSLPTGSNTIGAVTISGTPSVTLSGTANTVVSTPKQYTATDCSGTITTGGTSQTALASNTSRHAWYVQNTSTANEAINFTSAASLTSGSIILVPNAMFSQEGVNISSDAITIIGATTGQAFVCKSF